MPTTVRQMPRPAAVRAGAPARRPSRPVPPHRPHPHAAPTTDTTRLVVIGAAIVVAAVIAVGVIWEFGAARNLAVPPYGAVGRADGVAATPDGRPATKMYRDLHDGRIMVMEIGPGGTRLKGTVPKSEVPFADEGDSDGGTSRGKPDTSAADRVNALGSAFR